MTHHAHHADEPIDPHGPTDHGDDGGHDDHAHATEPLGPIDVAAWGTGIVGVVLGLVVAFALALSTGAVG